MVVTLVVNFPQETDSLAVGIAAWSLCETIASSPRSSGFAYGLVGSLRSNAVRLREVAVKHDPPVPLNLQQRKTGIPGYAIPWNAGEASFLFG